MGKRVCGASPRCNLSSVRSSGSLVKFCILLCICDNALTDVIDQVSHCLKAWRHLGYSCGKSFITASFPEFRELVVDNIIQLVLKRGHIFHMTCDLPSSRDHIFCVHSDTHSFSSFSVPDFARDHCKIYCNAVKTAYCTCFRRNPFHTSSAASISTRTPPAAETAVHGNA